MVWKILLQCSAARRAIESWTLVAIRFNIVKDVRVLIGKMIWKAKEEANYKADEVS